MAHSPNPNLKSFNAYADENGQNMGQDSPTDLARPAELQRILASDPGGEAETARLASGRKNEGADAQTAAETPAANLKAIGDPTSKASVPEGEAIARATAALGEED